MLKDPPNLHHTYGVFIFLKWESKSSNQNKNKNLFTCYIKDSNGNGMHWTHTTLRNEYQDVNPGGAGNHNPIPP